jgi:hypothetical protein
MALASSSEALRSLWLFKGSGFNVSDGNVHNESNETQENVLCLEHDLPVFWQDMYSSCSLYSLISVLLFCIKYDGHFA